MPTLPFNKKSAAVSPFNSILPLDSLEMELPGDGKESIKNYRCLMNFSSIQFHFKPLMILNR